MRVCLMRAHLRGVAYFCMCRRLSAAACRPPARTATGGNCTDNVTQMRNCCYGMSVPCVPPQGCRQISVGKVFSCIANKPHTVPLRLGQLLRPSRPSSYYLSASFTLAQHCNRLVASLRGPVLAAALWARSALVPQPPAAVVPPSIVSSDVSAVGRDDEYNCASGIQKACHFAGAHVLLWPMPSNLVDRCI